MGFPQMWPILLAVILVVIDLYGSHLAYKPKWKRLFRKKEPPFRLLDLPRELREEIYWHVLPSYIFRPERSGQFKPPQPINILYTSHQIWEEATYTLYLRKRLVFVVGERVWRSDPWKNPPTYRAALLLDRMWRHKTLLANVRNVALEIDWPEWSWYCPSPGKHERFGGMKVFLANLETLCLAIQYLPQMHTLTIDWQRRPPTYRIPVLLRPLKVIRRSRPEVVVEMPVDSPISSAKLAEQQRDSEFPEVDLQQEANEDLAEMQGDLARAALNLEKFRERRKERRVRGLRT